MSEYVAPVFFLFFAAKKRFVVESYVDRAHHECDIANSVTTRVEVEPA